MLLYLKRNKSNVTIVLCFWMEDNILGLKGASWDKHNIILHISPLIHESGKFRILGSSALFISAGCQYCLFHYCSLWGSFKLPQLLLGLTQSKKSHRYQFTSSGCIITECLPLFNHLAGGCCKYSHWLIDSNPEYVDAFYKSVTTTISVEPCVWQPCGWKHQLPHQTDGCPHVLQVSV